MHGITFVDKETGEELTRWYNERATAEIIVAAFREENIPAWHVHEG